MDLALFYFLLLGFSIFMYVLLDGFDLGIGILYPWFDQDGERDHLMRSISHVWDGNETWLVFGGVMLFAAFPAAYAAITTVFYLPIMLMLFALIFRGVAFEYRFKSDTSRPYWDFAFSAGSAIAAFCQGMLLGSLVQGIPAGSHSLSSLHWLTPFSVLTGFAVMAGYALLAACYLYMKSRGQIQQHAAKLGKYLLMTTLFAMVAVSLWTVISQPAIRDRWFTDNHFLLLSPLPILTFLAALFAWRGLHNHQHESRPFWCAAIIFLLSFAGLVVGLFPYLIPGQLTFMAAASPDSSLYFLLPGVCIFIPLICLYTLWGYRVFSGKVEDYQEGY
ncbi:MULTISPECIES: cytochrome d ubiquinol oxidase subunit II [unclassified Oceanobacter]|uniref:cytochrome d ubiquinol oxidase subunit II n=1 Tax=unclassified Oceanobacter TaxID=2620260 RepID=UPI0027322F05|nr:MULTISPECIES: cytochrome d ubiquinol oxidase subunit II [unclassified Oceanobacter]MDP2505503.1 cytochrome d ubiquinol oxidase subunit II [Oceanobacter sp. 3_MG-2023]MDP2548648.1 cytochrome d ubiquinol oxidase subunit II [Oceanobacter sp. 4_MG-2023]MDP2610268.1 cytochrome d ubiquinol oxidase subunit II [Oceanobacter sp. 1_MG-2023]MDP2613594.1 cytochrome d ubiquinol oxidase subunit II [Oceanobacter sp. 2_MG-2023]